MPDQPSAPQRQGTGTLAALASLRQEPVRSLLPRLLADKSTGKNIIWATGAYATTAPGCVAADQMTPEASPNTTCPLLHVTCKLQQSRLKAE